MLACFFGERIDWKVFYDVIDPEWPDECTRRLESGAELCLHRPFRGVDHELVWFRVQ